MYAFEHHACMHLNIEQTNTKNELGYEGSQWSIHLDLRVRMYLFAAQHTQLIIDDSDEDEEGDDADFASLNASPELLRILGAR